MKKTLFAMALFAVASLNSFGAVCGSFVLSASPTTCTVTDLGGTNSWTLSNWSLSSVSQVGYSTIPTTANINVSVTSIANGFEVLFTGITTNGNNFFAPAGNNQQANFKTGFWILPTLGGPIPGSNSLTGVDNISLAEVNPVGTDTFSVTKSFQDLTGVNLATATQVFYVGTNAGCNQAGNASCFIIGTTNPTSNTFFNNRTAGFSIVDAAQFNSGETGNGSIGGYKNTFTVIPAQTGVPEPMTFVLMGAGLVGVAFLRRRNG
ncbi:MAG: PEP-CTERM sorting domain-containing protein [Acidobacteria bacterium]|nr:PEP-CTERM sorting domain-containing protein [Acidobacteriota bacterium]